MAQYLNPPSRFIWPLLVVLSLALFLFIAADLLISKDNNISGIAPTMNVDDTEITDMVGIRILHSLNSPGGPYDEITQLLGIGPGEAFTYLDPDRGHGQHCYVATAFDSAGNEPGFDAADNESDFSNEDCVTVDTVAPRPPTGLAVE